METTRPVDVLDDPALRTGPVVLHARVGAVLDCRPIRVTEARLLSQHGPDDAPAAEIMPTSRGVVLQVPTAAVPAWLVDGARVRITVEPVG